ncbi:MAG: hypothetical protein Q9162_005288 [Coniocarpon cinnabarinum]
MMGILGSCAALLTLGIHFFHIRRFVRNRAASDGERKEALQVAEKHSAGVKRMAASCQKKGHSEEAERLALLMEEARSGDLDKWKHAQTQEP